MLINFNIVKKIINEWNPIGVLPYAPDDEYIQEINLICNKIEAMDFDCNKEKYLSEEIFKIFQNQLDSEAFSFYLNDCLEIAIKILKEIKNIN